MMRSLFAGVSGLKSHQTRMDVIGNNIANVNTTGYKAKTINFSDMLYQTTQSATGPNTANGTAGTNPRQIGLGVKTGAINTSITTEGSTQSTGNPFDLKITGEAFFIVSDGTNQYYTRDGSFNVDAAGYLAMGSTGYTVLGWPADVNGTLQTGTVKPIQLLSESNSTYAAAGTTAATISGIVDEKDVDFDTTNGQLFNVSLYDKKGEEYSLQFGLTPTTMDKQSTNIINNKDMYYDIPDDIYLVDNSKKTYTVSYTSGGTAQLEASSMPGDLLKKIDSLLSKARKEGNLTLGTPTSVSFKIEEVTPNSNYKITANIGRTTYEEYTTDLKEYSTLVGSEVKVELDGKTAYSTKTDESGIIDISEATIKAIYGNAPTSGATHISSTTNLLITEKSYSDGTKADPKIFTATRVGGATSSVTLSNITTKVKYSELAGLLSATKGETQSQYTTTETTTKKERLAGQYQIKLLGMIKSNGEVQDLGSLEGLTNNLVFNASDGKFSYVGSEGQNTFTVDLSRVGENGNFENIEIDVSSLVNADNSGKTTLESAKGNLLGDSATKGRKLGTLSGVAIGTDGVVTANYSNGMSKTIAQIAVATFANAMGLENKGDNVYSSTANTGDVQIVDIKASGTGYMTTGVLEMSNVDLSQQFTDMITTQRGFQANSRIITTSDSLLEELVNLKR